ncbi:hypothetical protein [Streptomyces globisporus]
MPRAQSRYSSPRATSSRTIATATTWTAISATSAHQDEQLHGARLHG